MVETQKHTGEEPAPAQNSGATEAAAGMVWDAWGIPAGHKPLSAQIRNLLTQVFGVSGDPVARRDEGDVLLRESALTPDQRDGLAGVVGGGQGGGAPPRRVGPAGG
ncbi:hypothetical protein [Nocardia brasiliensis]|uniref:hypothetical protein n=1 Tax=Nocardia brasiliensis TaxID=37326 RepID=UPI0024553B54|nr:hypothetical protein [Nocardia brasiliensis]